MTYQATGRLHKVFDTEQKSASFSAREFVIEMTDGKYPQMIKFQLTQDKCKLIDDFSEGDSINVEFDLRGREWNDRYFTNLDAWRISPADDEKTDTADQENEDSGPSNAAEGAVDDLYDDIPF